MNQNLKIAILIPCFNEALTIGKVIQDFKKELPQAEIFVYDNNSKDETANIADQLGAIVKTENRQGKGNVICSMFREVNADIYIMVDGDDTYPAEKVHGLIEPIIEGKADMSIGDRLTNGTYKDENKRMFHSFGNVLVQRLINRLFHANIQDIMTGYRAFNQTFVKHVPILSEGFEVETEITIHALYKKFKIVEIPIIYRDRPEGSFSKLNTIRDGIKVVKTIFQIFKDYKPFLFFSIISFLLLGTSIALGVPIITEFMKTGKVPRFPTAILATGLTMLSAVSFTCGLILETIAKHQRENFELFLKSDQKN